MRSLQRSGGPEGSHKNFVNSHQNSHLTKTKKTTSRGGLCNLLILMVFLAPEVGLEPTTLRLTAECSAIELLRNALKASRANSDALTCYNKSP